jgi:Flp pilus assembly protein TadG
MTMRTAIAKDERGAETVEFALVFPVVAFLILGLLYGLFAVAAHVSLAHAASRGVRYASIPVDAVSGVYRTTEEVEAFVDENTPFFTASSCETTVTGDALENAPVTLDIVCGFPNPAGKALSGLRDLLLNTHEPDRYADALAMSAHAEARRE